jgi:signal transduction histidine kinase
VDACRAGELCRIRVQDNGVGIPAEDLGRIFEPFVRLYGEEDYKGVGLGLPTARKAVELMGGRAGVDSALGIGSAFWIELPYAAGGEP